jgi:hypothetical protein
MVALTNVRWLLVESCATGPLALNGLHRLYLTPDGQPSLEPKQHPREHTLALRTMAVELTLARLGHAQTPACVVVAVWLDRHQEIARSWAASLYPPGGGVMWPHIKHVRLCLVCGEPIPRLMLGYQSGPRFCDGACRTRARRARKTADQYRRERVHDKWPF